MIFRVADIETVPDFRCFTPSEPTYKLGEGGVAIKSEAFPPPQANQVVAISYVDVEFDPAIEARYVCRGCFTDCQWGADQEATDVTEKDLLNSWSQVMNSRSDIHLVTWNGRVFDLPVLSLRSFRHGIPCKWYYEDKNTRYRYSSEKHLDLMDYLSDYGACRPMKLGDAARLIGLPGKIDISGASVEEMITNSRKIQNNVESIKEKIARYCLQDSIQTAILFLRSRQHLGKLTSNTYRLALKTFQEDELVKWAMLGDVDWDRISSVD